MIAAVSQRATLPPYQTRMCARCGHSTTFVLEDPAGGWYVCVECGHFA
jgi:transposase